LFIGGRWRARLIWMIAKWSDVGDGLPTLGGAAALSSSLHDPKLWTGARRPSFAGLELWPLLERPISLRPLLERVMSLRPLLTASIIGGSAPITDVHRRHEMVEESVEKLCVQFLDVASTWQRE